MSKESLLTRIPENTSFLQANKFTFVFPTLPFLKYFCQTVTLPSVSTSPVSISTPFSDVYRHGDKLVYDQLNVTAIIDEDLRVWEETYNWMLSLTKPEEFEQYVRYVDKKADPYHDGVLTLNTNSNIPNIRITFQRCHPVSIGSVNFSVMENAQTIMTLDITFRYDGYLIQRLTK